VSHDSPQQRLQPSHHFAIDSPHDSCRKGDDPSKVAHGVLSDERCESTITHVLRKGAFLAKSTSSSSHATAQTRPITRTREIAPPWNVPVELIPPELRMPNTRLWLKLDERLNILQVWRRDE